MASKPPFMMKSAPAKKGAFKACSACKSPAKCKAAGKCLAKGK
jgi:hypothetical protein